MRIALIADVHGNLPALLAVIKHAKKHGADQIWNLGDNVGYGPFSNEVIDTLRQTATVNILGNYDKKAYTLEERSENWRKNKNPVKLKLLELAAEQTTDDNRTWSLSQPEIVTREAEGQWVMLTHASPRSRKEAITPQTPSSYLRELSNGMTVNLVALGHSHQTMWRQLRSVSWANPGSVGRQNDGDPRARYALLDVTLDGFRFFPKIVEYDIETLCKRCRELRLPRPVTRVFTLGRGLEWIL